GALEHKDSMGNGSVIRPGDVQRMTAGTGVLHSEFNHSASGITHFLQIWIEPNRRGLAPGYEERHFPAEQKRGRLRLVAAGDGVGDAVHIHQDTRIYVGLFDGGEADRLELAPGRKMYVHVARGALTVNGQRLLTGDAAKFSDEPSVEFVDGERAEVLAFDLP
ncbi:MAG: pirin family protein, partial [Burkholderiales bacterium]